MRPPLILILMQVFLTVPHNMVSRYSLYCCDLLYAAHTGGYPSHSTTRWCLVVVCSPYGWLSFSQHYPVVVFSPYRWLSLTQHYPVVSSYCMQSILVTVHPTALPAGLMALYAVHTGGCPTHSTTRCVLSMYLMSV